VDGIEIVASLVLEAIHATSAFGVAGFRVWPAPRWPVGDRRPCAIAHAFHTALRTSSGQVDPARAGSVAAHLHVGAS